MDKNATSFWAGETWKIPKTDWEIIGYSRASYRTGFYIKSLDLMVDAGPQFGGNPGTILVTHGHGDHIANIPFTIINKNVVKNMDGELCIKIPTIFVHEKTEEYLKKYVNSMFELNNCDKFDFNVANWVSVKGNEHFENYLVKNNKSNKIDIKTFECVHDVPCVAYGLSVRKNLLKEEYKGLEGKELGALRKNGVEITSERIVDIISFVWDTTIDVLEKNPSILNYNTVMIECTYLTEDDYEVSLTRKHIHWKSLKPYVESNPDTLFVLVHFSLRYKNEEIEEFFNNENLPNVKPWIN